MATKDTLLRCLVFSAFNEGHEAMRRLLYFLEIAWGLGIWYLYDGRHC